MKNRLNEAQDFDRRLTRALEARPTVTVPPQFATRVASLATSRVPPAKHAGARGGSSVGMAVAWVAVAFLLVMLCVLSLTGSAGALHWMAYTLEADFVVLATWLSLTRLVFR